MTKAHLFLLATSLLTGCGVLDNCPDGHDPITIDTGSTDPEMQLYWSADWEGPRDAFPAKTELIFEHHLGGTPRIVQAYVSFSSEGTDVTPSAGNQSEINCVDSQVIKIFNNTCEDHFFIVVSASGIDPTATRVCDAK
jgi:hypothetical protein